MGRRTARIKRWLAGVGVFIVFLFTTDPAASSPHGILMLDASTAARRDPTVIVPLAFGYENTTITALVFSIDLDTERLAFDPTDDDMDGIPDAVTLPAGTPSITFIGYDPSDARGEIDVMLANLSGAPLPQGVILEFELLPATTGFFTQHIRFSADPPASFGNVEGQGVEGTTLVLGQEIFADGFESGDTSAWRKVRPFGERQ